MKLVEFPEQTIVIAEHQPEYVPLPAHRFCDDSQGRIACCWQLTWRERLRLLFTGRIWHQVLTFNQPLQPQLLSVEKPVMPTAAEFDKYIRGDFTLAAKEEEALARHPLKFPEEPK